MILQSTLFMVQLFVTSVILAQYLLYILMCSLNKRSKAASRSTGLQKSLLLCSPKNDLQHGLSKGLNEGTREIKTFSYKTGTVTFIFIPASKNSYQSQVLLYLTFVRSFCNLFINDEPRETLGVFFFKRSNGSDLDLDPSP